MLSTNAIQNVTAILEKPEDYIESAMYASWEQYFTKLLIEQTKDNQIWAYTKRKLEKVYLSSRMMNAVKKVMYLIKWD